MAPPFLSALNRLSKTRPMLPARVCAAHRKAPHGFGCAVPKPGAVGATLPLAIAHHGHADPFFSWPPHWRRNETARGSVYLVRAIPAPLPTHRGPYRDSQWLGCRSPLRERPSAGSWTPAHLIAAGYLRKLVIRPAFPALWRNIDLVTQLTRKTSQGEQRCVFSRLPLRLV